MYLSYSLNFATNKPFFFFSKMALVEFQYKPVSLEVKEVCFDEEQGIPNT